MPAIRSCLPGRNLPSVRRCRVVSNLLCLAETPLTASVLALPADSIHPSKIRPGDQLIVCATGELTWRKALLSFALGVAEVYSGAVECCDTSGRVTELRTPQFVERPAPHESRYPQPQANQQRAESERRDCGSARGWLEKWLFPAPPNPRKFPPRPAPCLVAYF
jgi:hypothetical protein